MLPRTIKIVIAIGSNVEQETHLDEAKEKLQATFDKVVFSSAVWTEPIGLSGSDRFLNALAVGYTQVAPHRVEIALKDIERQCGRTRTAPSNVVALDLDLLLYDGEICHPDDWGRDYIQSLAQQIGVEVPTEEERKNAVGYTVRKSNKGRKKKKSQSCA